MDEKTPTKATKSSPRPTQRLRPWRLQQGPQREGTSKQAAPDMKSTFRKQAPLQLRREVRPKSNFFIPSVSSSSSTINIRRQGSAPPEFNTQGPSTTKNKSSMRSANSISNIFSEFGREMQRKFTSRPKSVDQTHFYPSTSSSTSGPSRITTTSKSSRNTFGTSRSVSSIASNVNNFDTSRSMSTLNLLDENDIPTDIPAPIQTQPAFGLGLYMDEDEITVGTIPHGVGKPEMVVRRKAEISFLENNISIGESHPSATSFRVSHLVKSGPKLKNSFKWRSESFTFSSEEILAILFEKLFQDVQDTQQVSTSVDNVILTCAFLLTSLEKERLRQALKIAGVNNSRILSSIVTTAVAHTNDNGYYLKNIKTSKLIFVVHSLVNSFSMAVVQISPHSIATKCCIGSENLDECKEDSFETGHAQMFSDVYGSLSPEQEASVWLAYEGAVHQLLKGIPESKISKIIGVTRSWNEFKLNHILQRIFGDKEMNIRSTEAPLTGACILAGKKFLPQGIEVHDASRTNLMIVSGPKKWRLECKNRKHVPGNVFTLDVPVPAQGMSLILYEEFCKGKLSNPVAQYKIVASMQPHIKNYDVLVRCFVTVDQDGVYSVGPHFSREVSIRSFLRTDPLAGDISLEIRRLKVCYDNVNYKRRSTLVRQSSVEETQQEELPQEEFRIWANDAERLYIDTLRRFNLQGKTPEELKEEHEKAKTETLKRFQTNCQENGIDPINWMEDVEMKLEVMFLDVKEFLTSSKSKFKDWFNKKFPKAKSDLSLDTAEELEDVEREQAAEEDMELFKSNQDTLDSETDGNNNAFENEYDTI